MLDRKVQCTRHDPGTWTQLGLAHDVICFDSFLDQKMLERWLLRCHSSVVVVKFWVLRPVIVTVVICWDVMLRILVPNLFYFDLGYFFVTPWCYLVYDVSHPWILVRDKMRPLLTSHDQDLKDCQDSKSQGPGEHLDSNFMPLWPLAIRGGACSTVLQCNTEVALAARGIENARFFLFFNSAVVALLRVVKLTWLPKTKTTFCNLDCDL